ncbi:MAG: hypothetical protein GEU92_02150 [Alphaproteobacteria bacterium]|nr:hypothetical protein [Alphaproteobacteria bacterium]
MKFGRSFLVAPLLLMLGACSGSWSTANVQRPDAPSGDAGQTASLPRTDPAKIVITESDIGDRPYEAIGDISVTVNKTSLLHPDPTKELVAQKLRAVASKIGADAVILVRYGTVGISFMTWGSLDGKGRAVKFK